MDDAAADAIAKRAAPVYYITGAIHSTEARRTDGVDGAGISARRRRQRLRPQHPRARHHADHAGRRTGRPRPRRRCLQLAQEVSEPDAGQPDLLGPVRRARQQSRRDGGDAEADAERPQHLRGMEGAGAARPARVRVVPLRQHHRQRSVQRLARSDPDQRVASDRLEQRQRDDPDGDARRVSPGEPSTPGRPAT